MEAWLEWKPPWENPAFSELIDDFGAKDWVWRCPKLEAVGMESLDCIPSICGGSPRLSRGFAESTAMVDSIVVRFKRDRTQ